MGHAIMPACAAMHDKLDARQQLFSFRLMHDMTAVGWPQIGAVRPRVAIFRRSLTLGPRWRATLPDRHL
jgi:hypothetical protein